MSYARYFMPLTCEARGYEFKGRVPAGRCVVETRGNTGKISLWAQDLKYETRYNIYIIFADAGRYAGVLVGALAVNARGKAEARKDIDNAELHGFAIQDVTAVAVVAVGEPGVVSPLCGYKDLPVLWKSGFYIAAQKTVEVEQKVLVEATPVIEPPVETTHHNQIPPTDELPEIPQNKTSSIDELNEIELTTPAEIIAKPLAEPEPITEPTSPPRPEPPPPKKKSAPPPKATKPKQESNLTKAFQQSIKQMTANIAEEIKDNEAINAMEFILANNPPMHPFENPTREANWVRFAISDAVPMPTNRPNLLDEPFVRAAYDHHGYMLLGATIDGGPKKYIIGLPRVYDPEHRGQAKRLGFSQFKCYQSPRAKRGELGYWLMFINV